MPQLQVIARQEDPLAKAIGQAGNDVADSLYKAQSLKLTGDYYKILAKNSETEIQKFAYQKKADSATKLAEIMKLNDPQQRAMAFKVLMDSKALDFGDTHDVSQKAEEYYKLLAKPSDQETATLENTRAQAAQRGAEASNLQAQTSVYNRFAGQMLGEQGSPAANGSRAAAVGGQAPNYIMPSLKTPLGDIVDVNATTQLKAAESEASVTGADTAKRNVALREFRKPFEAFKAVAQAIPRPDPNLGAGYVGAWIKNVAQRGMGGSGSAEGTITTSDLLRTYQAVSKNLRVAIARLKDVGNLSQIEQEAAEKLIPSDTDSWGTFNLKMAFIEDLGKAIDSGEEGAVIKLVKQYENQRKAKKVQPRASETGNQNAISTDLDNLFKGLK